jgi:hypothetical protein
MENQQIPLTDKAPYTCSGFEDKDGNPVNIMPSDVISVTSNNSAVAVVPDTTPAAGSFASGFLVPNAVATNVQITATVKHTDGTQAVESFEVDVIPASGTAFAFALGAPIAQ